MSTNDSRTNCTDNQLQCLLKLGKSGLNTSVESDSVLSCQYIVAAISAQSSIRLRWEHMSTHIWMASNSLEEENECVELGINGGALAWWKCIADVFLEAFYPY